MPVNFHSKWLQTTWLIFAHNSFQRIPLFLREIKHSKTNTLKYELKNYFKNNRKIPFQISCQESLTFVNNSQDVLHLLIFIYKFNFKIAVKHDDSPVSLPNLFIPLE